MNARLSLLALLALNGCGGVTEATVSKSDPDELVLTEIGGDDASATSVVVTAPDNIGYTSVTVDLGSNFLGQNICTGNSIFGRAGEAVCQVERLPGTTVVAGGAQILSGYAAWDTIGEAVAGTVRVYPSLNITQNPTFPAYFTALTTPTRANFCKTVSIFGQTGLASCISGTLPGGNSVLTSANLLSGTTGWDDQGVIVNGAMTNRATWNLTTSFPGTGYYSGVSGALGATQICSAATGGGSLAGVAGTAICQSGALGGGNVAAAAGQILSGYSAWNGSGTLVNGTIVARGALDPTVSFQSGYYSSLSATLAATEVCNTSTIFGVAGTATCAAGAAGPGAATAGDILTGKHAFDVGAVRIDGTMSDRGSWDLNANAFPGAGYYSGASFVGSAANVCTGTTLLGNAGTAMCVSGAPPGVNTEGVAANLLATKSLWSSAGALVNGTMTDRGAWNINTTAIPGAGYYSSISTTLAAADVCPTKTIFGNTGTAICQSGAVPGGNVAAAAAQIRTGYTAWNGAGTLVNGTMPDRGSVNLNNESIPGAGYYDALSLSIGAGQVCEGTSIFGSPGTGKCSFTSNVNSTATRDVATAPITLTTELATGLPAGYREVPDAAKDDDSAWDSATATALGGSCTGAGSTATTKCTTAVRATRPSGDCGTTGTITARIADCLAVNPSTATWDGSTSGTGAEGIWKLVTRISDAGRAYEVWRDETSKLLWSDRVGDLSNNDNQGIFNWCLASGNTQSSTYGVECRLGVDSATNNNRPGISLCHDDGAGALTTPNGVHNTTTLANLTSWTSATLTNSQQNSVVRAKGNLTRASGVYWRLPTRADYLRAEIAGARLALPNMVVSNTVATVFWTATVVSANRLTAWGYGGSNGAILSNARDARAAVRCVGYAP